MMKEVLTLDAERRVLAGNPGALVAAIRRGADLRVGTGFHHNEHIDSTSANPELINETVLFDVTYLVDERWAAGVITQRQPVAGPGSFGPRPSMSFFLYNQDGQQAIARLRLDGGPTREPSDDNTHLPKYHLHSEQDADTNAPSTNFIYDFDVYRFLVRDDWQEVLAHDANGAVCSGSLAALTEAVHSGCDVKVAVRGLCCDLAPVPAQALEHEVFIQTHSCYHYAETGLFLAATRPAVRVGPAMPMLYRSQGWDVGWFLPHTDGLVVGMLLDPYSLKFRRTAGHYALRWLVR
jgi:hypothetical protein